MATITINGASFSGSSITISNGKVFINGKDCTPDGKEINISVEGNIEKLDADACNMITVNGNTGDIKTQSGDVDVSGNVTGSVSTMSGDVDCKQIGGSVSTMSGDIDYKR